MSAKKDTFTKPTKARWTNPPTGEYPRQTDEAWWYAQGGGIDFVVQHFGPDGKYLRTDIFRLRPSELQYALRSARASRRPAMTRAPSDT